MTFSNDFEQLLDEYKIDVSDRTRRIIRRNMEKTVSERTKRWIRRNAVVEVPKVQPGLFKRFVVWLWCSIYFVLSVIFKITVGIMTCAICLACVFLKVAFEVYCVLLIIHITTVLMKQNLPN